MLTIVMDDRLLSPCQVCATCCLADSDGQPRWRADKLDCGRAIAPQSAEQPQQFECVMGFRVAHIR
ncbi:MAG: hypothetical protein ACFB9N_17970 [Geitlerinemataceae cyanobacterium]